VRKTGGIKLESLALRSSIFRSKALTQGKEGAKKFWGESFSAEEKTKRKGSFTAPLRKSGERDWGGREPLVEDKT